MTSYRLVGLTLGLALLAGQCLACGYDPCERSTAGFEVPCQHPDYIAPEFSDTDLLRILLVNYLQWPAVTNGNADEQESLDFSTYKTEVNDLLAQKHLPALELSDNYNPYYQGSGGCSSNSYATTLELDRAIAADREVNAGYQELFSLRHNLIGWCGGSDPQKRDELDAAVKAIRDQWPPQAVAGQGLGAASPSSPNGPGDYPYYIKGLIAFYGQDYSQALNSFENLSRTGSPWLRETTAYLLGRTHLLAALADYNGWDSNGIDQKQVDAADRAFAAYLKLYPQGRYAASAIGMKRRIFMLQEKTEQLNAELLRQFAPYLSHAQQTQQCDERCRNLTLEFFTTYNPTLPAPYEAPVIAAYTLMVQEAPTADLVAELESHQATFASYPGLFQLTRNILLYRLGRYQQLADTFAAPTSGEDDITVGNQVFFARALENLHQYGRARSVWNAIAAKHRASIFAESSISDPFALQRPATPVGRATDNYLQVARARNYLLAGDVQKLAARDSGVTDPMLLESCFIESATDNDLKVIIANPKATPDVRKLAQTTLMNRLLFEKRYGDFVAMLKQLRDPGIYTQVQTAAVTLQNDPNNPKGLLNLGYFLAYHHLVPQESYKETEVLRFGFAPKRADRPQKDVSEAPFRLYLKALKQYGPQDHDENEAKLLHYLIMAFKQSNDTYYTTWWQVKDDENKGKDWFDRLKSKYPQSKWRKKTKYYY